MALIVVKGDACSLDCLILALAVRQQPCLFIDCSNSANPHKILPVVEPDDMQGVRVLQAELLYTFREILGRLPLICRASGIKRVFISTQYLIDYDDEVETRDLFSHCKELLFGISGNIDVLVGFRDDWFWDSATGVAIPAGAHASFRPMQWPRSAEGVR